MSKKITAKAGDRFGSLLFIREIDTPAENKMKQVFWECACDCGRTHKARSVDIRQGRTHQCCHCSRGQAGDSQAGQRKGHLRAYRSWSAMKDRCCNPNNPKYHRYGGRGIAVCPEWVSSFDKFLEDMGDPPAGMTIDRTDNALGYEKGNCRWQTPSGQARNRSNNTAVTINGETRILIDWCEQLGLNYKRVVNRICRGWVHEKALTTPF